MASILASFEGTKTGNFGLELPTASYISNSTNLIIEEITQKAKEVGQSIPLNPMLVFSWNCHSCLSYFITSHKPQVIYLSELKFSLEQTITHVLSSLHCPYFRFIPIVGRSGSLVLDQKLHLDIQIVVANSSPINCLVFCFPSSTCSLLLSMVQLSLKKGFLGQF